MKVNQDRVKIIIGKMREDAVRASSINSFSRYSFEAFCQANHIYDDRAVKRGDDIRISCPFHSDSTPSCSLNEAKWVYNCFGCKGGNWVDFAFRYHTEILGEKLTWYQFLNKLLRDDAALQSSVGFESIYEKENVSLGQIGKFEKQQFKGATRMPGNYLELWEKYKKTNPTFEQKKFFVLLMQREVPVKDAYGTLFGKEGQEASGQGYDLKKMGLF